MRRLLLDHGILPGQWRKLPEGERLYIQALYLADARERENG